MNLIFYLFLIFSSIAISSPIENYPAERLKVGTEVEVLKDIYFNHRQLESWVQYGHFKSENPYVGLDRLDPHCKISLDISNYNPETGKVKSILKGKYKIAKKMNLKKLRGSVGWQISPINNGVEFHLQCDKSATLMTRIADRFWLYDPLYVDNIFKIDLKTVKNILKGLIEIK